MREQHRVSWSEPRELPQEELAEYQGYVRTEDGVASPDNFTPAELTEITAENLIIESPAVDPMTAFVAAMERDLKRGIARDLPRSVRRADR